jgi:hypothetical protein
LTTEESFLQSSAQGAVKRWVSNKNVQRLKRMAFAKTGHSGTSLWECHRERTKVVSAVIQCRGRGVRDGRWPWRDKEMLMFSLLSKGRSLEDIFIL